MSTMTPREILARARLGIIDPARWHQGSFMKGEAACSIGWLNRASGFFRSPYEANDLTNLPARNHAIDYLHDAAGLGKHESIPSWQDAPERTHAEVVAAFDRALLMAAADEGLPVRSDDARTDEIPHGPLPDQSLVPALA